MNNSEEVVPFLYYDSSDYYISPESDFLEFYFKGDSSIGVTVRSGEYALLSKKDTHSLEIVDTYLSQYTLLPWPYYKRQSIPDVQNYKVKLDGGGYSISQSTFNTTLVFVVFLDNSDDIYVCEIEPPFSCFKKTLNGKYEKYQIVLSHDDSRIVPLSEYPLETAVKKTLEVQ